MIWDGLTVVVVDVLVAEVAGDHLADVDAILRQLPAALPSVRRLVSEQ